MKVLALTLALVVGEAGVHAQVRDLNGRPVDSLRIPPEVKADVLIFSSIECPISNRYVPEIRRLAERFASAGIRFRVVFANPGDGLDAILDHVQAFGYPGEVLYDPRHELVRLTKVTVTSEAAVLDRRGAIVYRGRIDDRYADVGVDRQTPARHDLEDAIAAVLDGRPVPNPVTQAVGCFLADFVR